MTLLDELEGILSICKQRFEEEEELSAAFAFLEIRERVAYLLYEHRKHLQPVTPEAVVEWMGLEWEKSYKSYHLTGFKGLEWFQLMRIGSEWWIQIDSSVRGEVIVTIPLSRFRSMDDLETFVRQLGADER